MKTNFIKIQFDNGRGEQLGARLDLPVDGRARAFALFAHCFTCTKNLRAVQHISHALTDDGIGVLRFDFTGLGESEGDFADTNFSSNVQDLVAAANFLADEYLAPQLLIGHSLGGAAVLQAAGSLPSVQAVATLGAPCNPEHVTHLLRCSQEEIERTGEAIVELAGRRFTIKKQFLDDLEGRRMDETIRTLRRALLVLHSPLDNTVGVENAAHIFQLAKHPKSFISLDTADHLLSNEADARFAGQMIGAWARMYVTPLESEDLFGPEDNTVVVRTEDTYRTAIRAGNHTTIADEPRNLGGTDLGPNPYDLLLASLGACTSITLRMYADRKEWPLETIRVRLSHDKVHAKDCAECESTKGKVDLIERRLELFGPLDDAQRRRLTEIANRCPVHRTLHSQTVVRTFLLK